MAVLLGGFGSVIGNVLNGGTNSISSGGGGSTQTGTLLNLDLSTLVDLNIGAGGVTSIVTVDGTIGTTGSTPTSPVIDLGIDLGTGLTGGRGGLLGGLLGGSSASGGGGLIPDTVAGVVGTVSDLAQVLLGGGSSSGGGTPSNPGTPGQIINGSEGADVLRGTVGNDTINGLGGNDLIYGYAGNDIINGGTGRDTVVIGQSITEFTAASQNGILGLRNKTTGEMDFLANVERINFTDHTLALDFNGDAGQGFRLYQAAFDRAPDTPGLTHNVRLLDGGLSLGDLADGFVASAEFKATYGANLSNEQYVTQLYGNTLHRQPDAVGFHNWVNALNNSVLDRGDVLVGFSESIENHNQTDPQLQNGILLDYSVA